MATLGTWNVENLYRPGGRFGPKDEESYQAKLRALADTIIRLDVDVLAVQEVGEPEALEDLAARLGDDWTTVLSEHPDGRGIRVGFLGRVPMTVIADDNGFPDGLSGVQADDSGDLTTRAGRGILVVEAEPRPAEKVQIINCHLKSKLLTFPPLPGRSGTRFQPRDEGERARYAAYALFRRAAEAATARAMAGAILDEKGRERAVLLMGDLNDEVQAATTQILLGPPGSEIGTPGEKRPDKGDGARLWNLAPLIPEKDRFSRVYRGRRELIDHILASHVLLDQIKEVHSDVTRGLPSITDDAAARRDVRDSDHAPVVVRIG